MSAIDRASAAQHLEAFLRAIGAPVELDPELRGTGARVTDAWVDELLVGYAADPAHILAEGTESSSKGLVLLADVPATTMCPHHLLPASGRVHVGYWPGPRVVGFGAIARLVECHTRRLALQEDIARAIADALVEHLGAESAGVVVDLVPSCLTARGERPHGAHAITTSFAGRAASEPALRQELLLSLRAR
ncbi:MAG: GTP cyclohydrolase I [Sandaracinaceae bacterium]|jgi:GTP cyclohydrolase I|nr:GTP cyclohydrolase I [Sandaracinaceae bacterium]